MSTRPAIRPRWRPDRLEKALVRVGLEVEEIVDLRATVTGPLVVGRVLAIEELTGFKKPIRHCQVDVGAVGSTPGEPQSIVCGATNFAAGDLVVVALPGSVLPGDFAIASRQTYGRLSDGMICSARELGIGDDHAGIIVLPPDTAVDGVAVRPGDDARPVVGLDDIVVELAITPDRGYCFSARGVARELAHSLDLPYTDPAAAITPVSATAGGYPVQVLDERGCDRFTAVTVRGVDPTAASPDWMTTASDPRRHAADLADRRHHELPDARPRPADARVRPEPPARARSWSGAPSTARRWPRWTARCARSTATTSSSPTTPA